MLRFFRQIRQRLLTDNKFRKYLLYAVGEILLVVIGILIALQVNNWNETRKKKQLKASYETSLINDLALDTLLLGKIINENNRTVQSLNSQRERILGLKTPVDTLVKIARDEFEPELNTRFQYHRNTWNTLIASGNIDLFPKALNEKIMTLIAMQDLERENSKYYQGIYSDRITRFTDNFPVSKHQNSNIVNAIWTNADTEKLASGFISLTDIKGFAHLSFIRDMEAIKKETENVLRQLHAAE
jgi:hypothetical protein